MDWNDSKLLSDQANETIRIANEYRSVRKQWADAKLLLDCELALKYASNEVPTKLAYEKALVLIYQEAFTSGKQEIVKAYKDYVRMEADYKGLEKVLDANQNRISLCQSLIKNQIRNT